MTYYTYMLGNMAFGSVGSELQSFGAEGADRSRSPFVEKRTDAVRERVAWVPRTPLHVSAPDV
jgi:hypothetical protein